MSALLVLIGFLVGTFGTLIGAGGGFILLPILMLLFPDEPASRLTSISLVVVFFNTFSGSLNYAFKRKIHLRSAYLFSLASLPGAVLGAYTVRFIARERFEMIFGILMLAMAIYLLRGKKKLVTPKIENSPYPIYQLTDRSGEVHLISYNQKLGLAISAAVGFVSSLLGIGGGIIHVPAMVNLLYFPVHIATATSHSILAVMAFVGSLEHVSAGDLVGSWDKIIYLAPGVVLGAQLGAHLSPRIKGVWIVRALALALMTVALRFIFF